MNVYTCTETHTVFVLALREAERWLKANPCHYASIHQCTRTHKNSQKLLLSLYLGASDPHRTRYRMRSTFPLDAASLTHCLLSKGMSWIVAPAHLRSRCHHCHSCWVYRRAAHEHKTLTLYLQITHGLFSPALTFRVFIIAHTHTHTHTISQKPVHSHSRRAHGVCQYQSGFLGY